MLRDHPMQSATCTKWAHDAERCCMVCELHHSGVLQGGLQLYNSVCVVQIKASSCTAD